MNLVKLEGCRGPVPTTNPFPIVVYEQIDFEKGKPRVVQSHLKFKTELGLEFLSSIGGLYVIGHGWTSEGLSVVLLPVTDIQMGEGCSVCHVALVEKKYIGFRFVDARDKASVRIIKGDPQQVENSS